MANNNLHQAKKAKNDEFYTQLTDIEKECKHYIKHFNGQHIYCPCDTEDSNFWLYFKSNFKNFNLKRLTATHIDNNYRIDYDGQTVTRTPIGSGDFRSPDCTAIKDEADIIVTNPPFSLFRDFVAWLEGSTFIENNGQYTRAQQ